MFKWSILILILIIVIKIKIYNIYQFNNQNKLVNNSNKLIIMIILEIIEEKMLKSIKTLIKRNIHILLIINKKVNKIMLKVKNNNNLYNIKNKVTKMNILNMLLINIIL